MDISEIEELYGEGFTGITIQLSSSSYSEYWLIYDLYRNLSNLYKKVDSLENVINVHKEEPIFKSHKGGSDIDSIEDTDFTIRYSTPSPYYNLYEYEYEDGVDADADTHNMNKWIIIILVYLLGAALAFLMAYKEPFYRGGEGCPDKPDWGKCILAAMLSWLFVLVWGW